MGENIETFLAQLGNRVDEQTGAVSAPIHLSTTYSHPKFGHSTGFDYTRTKNPTRAILEEGLAKLEEGSPSDCHFIRYECHSIGLPTFSSRQLIFSFA